MGSFYSRPGLDMLTDGSRMVGGTEDVRLQDLVVSV